MNAHKTYGEKAWQQLHKNAAMNIEQILEATPHNTAAVRVSSWCNGLNDGLRNRSKRVRTPVRTPVTLLRSLSGKYP